MQGLIVQPVREALEYYRRLNEAAKDERHHRKSVADVGESTSASAAGGGGGVGGGGGGGASSVAKSSSSHSMRSKRSAGTVRSRSRSTDEDVTENLEGEDAENVESSDPETATEVEVSEKTLKFKISTEGTLSGAGTGRKSYPGSRKGSREKSSLDYHNHDLARAVREHERSERKRGGKGESLGSDLSSPASGWSAEETRILEELERADEGVRELDTRSGERRAPAMVEGNGNVVVEVEEGRNSSRRAGSSVGEGGEERARCGDGSREVRRKSVVGSRCCCEDKTGSNNHKSIFSRLRNFTDRLSISFDSKDPPTPKPTKHAATANKTLNKSNSITATPSAATTSSRSSQCNNSVAVCKRCNLAKSSSKEGKGGVATVVELSPMEKRAMTLPKVRKSADCKNKSWRTVFAKEKRSSASLEALPAAVSDTSLSKHRRNSSNPEGKSHSLKTVKDQKSLDMEFAEIDVRTKKQQHHNRHHHRHHHHHHLHHHHHQPEIIVKGVEYGSREVVEEREDVESKVEIRRSSASMEDISKMAKQAESAMLGSLEPKKASEERPHAGSLDSMLYKDSLKSRKKAACSSPTAASKKSSPGLLSRFKSGMSMDSTRSNSNSDSLHDQSSQSPSGWISSLTASFRPKRQQVASEPPPFSSSHPPRSPSREEIK